MHAARGPRPLDGYAAQQRGFSLIEALTVVTILAVLASVAIPNLTAMVKNSKLRGVATDLFGDMLTARSEAVKRNCEVDVTPDATAGWAGGWTVSSVACTAPGATASVAATQVAAHPALASDIKVGVLVNGAAGTASTVKYNSSGRISSGIQTVVFYESTSGTWARCLAVDTSGVPRISVDSKGVPANGCN